MTAEIAVMNKMAVALAADSAVTIGQKIYNTANKVFTLSKYHPVGIMVYGNSELNNVPWELIIKLYRKKLGTDKFNTLPEYATALITFLRRRNMLFPVAQQLHYFERTISSYFSLIKNDIDEEVKTMFDNAAKVQKAKIEKIVTKIIDKHYRRWKTYKALPNTKKEDFETTIKRYGKAIKEAKAAIFEKLPISISSFAKLKEISVNLFLKDAWTPGKAGIVITGFGEKDIFPSLVSFEIKGKIINKLIYKSDREAQITYRNNASIVPFAQRQMVDLFMTGIDPSYARSFEGAFSELLEDTYPETIVEAITKLDAAEKKRLAQKLKKLGSKLSSELCKSMEQYRFTLAGPIISAVAVLSKDELAAMAEALVNLTSFKQKMSIHVTETVGGPIDVAVISKGDGFIWIKRKHYFKPELNPYFLENYYRENQDEKGAKRHEGK